MRFDVSIIIVSFNKFDYLSRCLNSIVKHTSGISFEIIIVDNNSQEEGLSDIISQIQNVTLIENQENKGFAAANNQGIEIAKGKYCLILNNDTEFIANSIKEVFDFAKTKSSNLILGCQMLNPDGTLQESIVEFPSLKNILTEALFFYKIFPKSSTFNKYYQNYFKYDYPFQVDVVKGAFMFISKDDIIKLDGFDERFFFYSEETDLCLRFKTELGGEIYFLPKTRIIHYEGKRLGKPSWFHLKNTSIGKIKFYQKHFKGINKFSAIIIHYFGLFLRIIYNLVLSIFKFDSNSLLKSYYFMRQLFIYPRNRFN